MRIKLLLLGLLVYGQANAEVFKCVGKDGKILYQAKPCAAAIKARQLDIEHAPNNESKAQANLDAVRSEYEARKTAQQQAEKEAAKQRRADEQLEYARRSAIAQQEQAEAQRRQAEALERQNNNANRPFYILPPAHPKPHTTPPPPSLGPSPLLQPDSGRRLKRD